MAPSHVRGKPLLNLGDSELARLKALVDANVDKTCEQRPEFYNSGRDLAVSRSTIIGGHWWRGIREERALRAREQDEVRIQPMRVGEQHREDARPPARAVRPATVEVFLVSVEQELVPGDVVVGDNLAAHRDAEAIAAAARTGASVPYLPPHSADLKPIELGSSMMKHLIKSEKARDHDALKNAYAKFTAAVTPEDASGRCSPCREWCQAL